MRSWRKALLAIKSMGGGSGERMRSPWRSIRDSLLARGLRTPDCQITARKIDG